MATKLFDSTIVSTTEQALDFIGNILESSTEYSIIGKDLDGKILLWNENARRLYGYEPEKVVGKANSSILHTPEDVKAGKLAQSKDISDEIRLTEELKATQFYTRSLIELCEARKWRVSPSIESRFRHTPFRQTFPNRTARSNGTPTSPPAQAPSE